MVDIRFRPRSGSGASQGSPNTLGALREGTLATLLRDKTIDFPAPAVGSLGVCPGAIPRGRPEGVGHHSAHLLARCAQPHAPKSARSLEAPLTSVPGGSPATPPAPPGWPGPRLPCQLFRTPCSIVTTLYIKGAMVPNPADRSAIQPAQTNTTTILLGLIHFGGILTPFSSSISGRSVGVDRCVQFARKWSPALPGYSSWGPCVRVKF
ncbi:hypothetical protein PAPYR_6568 [Paratrimastix pyriformis]|uniref:Uncharacterized protein n=1 Tax=Paratrimastix pyriformis TaxID=342808 RepID=A0ABQ8UF66_9EUKA|nr:hypothetical protein PAPYR_6568 [Paratrimastix pyriformis]